MVDDLEVPEPGGDGRGQTKRGPILEISPAAVDVGPVGGPSDASARAWTEEGGCRDRLASEPEIEVCRSGFELAGWIEQKALSADLEPSQGPRWG